MTLYMKTTTDRYELPLIVEDSPTILACRKCNTRLCGVRCNGSEEPKQPVNIKGICDDAYCPECDYQLDELKELDCEQCPECGTRLDWTPWHRANDE